MFKRGLVALAMILVGLGVAVGMNPAPANAVPGGCDHLVVTWSTAHIVTDDGYNAWESTNYYTVPQDGCDKLYIGESVTHCGWYRFVVVVPVAAQVNGPWTWTCWTPQPASSGKDRWVRPGYLGFWEMLRTVNSDNHNISNGVEW